MQFRKIRNLVSEQQRSERRKKKERRLKKDGKLIRAGER